MNSSRTPAIWLASLLTGVSAIALAPIATASAQGVFAGTPTSQGFGDSLVDAADQGDIDAVTSLIRSGKYVDSQGRFGATALMRAAYQGHTDVVSLLLSVGAQPNITDVGQATPLHLAARQGFAEITRLLLLYDADVNAHDREGWTPLMRAALHGHGNIVNQLVTRGADVNAANKLGETALQHAAYGGDAAIVGALVKAGADVQMQDKHGVSAADLAYQRGHKDILRLLSGEDAVSEHMLQTAPPPPAAMSDATVRPETPPAPVSAPEASTSDSAPAFEIEVRPAPAAAPEIRTPAPVSQAPAPTPQKADKGFSLFSFFFGEDEREEERDTMDAAPATRVSTETVEAVTPAQPVTEGQRANPFAIRTQGVTPEAADGALLPWRSESSDTQQQPVMGDVVYLLQLGSFARKSDAEKHYNSLASQQTDILTDLQPVISEATIGESKTTVYRTQAGYLNDKAEAERLCAQLFSRSVECFVVESAIARPAVMTGPDGEPLPSPDDLPKADWVVTPETMPVRRNGSVPVPSVKPGAEDEEQDRGKFPEFEPFTLPSSQQLSDTAIAAPAMEEQPAVETTPAAPAVKVYPQNAPLPWLDAPAPALEISIPEALRTELYAQPAAPMSPAAADGMPQQMVALQTPAPTVSPLMQVPAESTFSGQKTFNDYYDGTGVYDQAANVQVAEAIQVPVSPDGMMAPEPAAVSPAALPSMNTRTSSQWIEMGAFTDERSAAHYWNSLTRSQPDLTSGLRFRVIRPLTAHYATGRITVRVGPIHSAQQVASLCEQAQRENLSCHTMQDSGRSFKAPLSRPSRSSMMSSDMPAPRGRHGRGMANPALEPSAQQHFWVQFGSFADRMDAEEKWEHLARTHDDILKDQNRNIVSPTHSSSIKQTYRLRVGPFTDQIAALKLCSQLQQHNVACITLKD